MLIILPDGPDGKIEEDIVSTKTEYTCHFTSGLEDRKKSKFDRRQNCNYLRNATGQILLKRQNEKKENEINKLRQSEQIKQQICMRYIWWIMFSRATTGRNDCQFHRHRHGEGCHLYQGGWQRLRVANLCSCGSK